MLARCRGGGAVRAVMAILIIERYRRLRARIAWEIARRGLELWLDVSSVS